MQPEPQVLADVVDVIRTSARLGPTIRVTSASHLAEDLAIDSLGMVRLALEFERRFGVEVAEEQMLGFRTVSDLVAYLSSERKAA
jgi:acyl carrier protein